MASLTLETRGCPPLANPRKRSRSQSEDPDLKNLDRPTQSRARHSPPAGLCPRPVIANHPFLLNVSTLSSEPVVLPRHPYLMLLGTPPARPNCAICLDTFSPSSPQCLARHTQCTPIYHTACLERWVAEGNPTCPYCRARLLPPPAMPSLFESDDESEDEEWNDLIGAMLIEADLADDPIAVVWEPGPIRRLLRDGHLRGTRSMGYMGREDDDVQQEDEGDEGDEVREDVEVGQQQRTEEQDAEGEVDSEQRPQQEEQTGEALPSGQPRTGTAATYIRNLFSADEEHHARR